MILKFDVEKFCFFWEIEGIVVFEGFGIFEKWVVGVIFVIGEKCGKIVRFGEKVLKVKFLFCFFL